MIRPPKLVYAAFLSALFILAGIGVIAARAWNGETLWPAAVSAIRDSNRGADPDYVQGLAKLGKKAFTIKDTSEVDRPRWRDHAIRSVAAPCAPATDPARAGRSRRSGRQGCRSRRSGRQG